MPLAPQLGQMPAPILLDYHGDIDPDIHYIIKVTFCFAMGALAMGTCLNVLAVLITGAYVDTQAATASLIFRMAFVLGITSVGASLLLVGLKVREDHSAAILFPRHWINALATGAAFSIIIWGPWLIAERGISFNRFAAAGIWMCLMAFPGIAALWVVGPRHQPV